VKLTLRFNFVVFLNLPTPRINNILLGKRAISADTALRLSRYFGASAQFWLYLQIDYDLRIATEAAGEQIANEIELLARARRPKLPGMPRGHAQAAALAAKVSSRVAAVKPRRKP
jgi:addiction module HigA family antidote